MDACPRIGHRSQTPHGWGPCFSLVSPVACTPGKTGPEHTTAQHKLWWLLFLGRNRLLARCDTPEVEV